jgi:hypothetical protein
MRTMDGENVVEAPAHEPAVVGARVVSPPGARVTETVVELSRAARLGLTIRASIPPARLSAR